MYEVRRGLLDDLATLNELKFAKDDAPEIVTRIAQYEMAYKMQASVPELTDFSTVVCRHSAAACAGELRPGGHSVRRGGFAYNCLMARSAAAESSEACASCNASMPAGIITAIMA